MPFSRMIVCARATRRRRSSTPIGGTSPRLLFISASSASAVDPPTPIVITNLLLLSPKPALDQNICRPRQPQRCRHEHERNGRPERPVVELELPVDQWPHHLEFWTAEQHGCCIGIHGEDEGQDGAGKDAR